MQDQDPTNFLGLHQGLQPFSAIGEQLTTGF